MNDAHETSPQPDNDATTNDATNDDLEALAGPWLSVPEFADHLGVSLSQARNLIKDRNVLAHRIGPNRATSVPARFVTDEGILAHLAGTITVLGDAGLGDAEILRWLFTPDDTLPVRGAPIDSLIAGRRAEIRKRASELAW